MQCPSNHLNCVVVFATDGFIKGNSSSPFFKIYSQFSLHNITSIKKYCLSCMLIACPVWLQVPNTKTQPSRNWKCLENLYWKCGLVFLALNRQHVHTHMTTLGALVRTKCSTGVIGGMRYWNVTHLKFLGTLATRKCHFHFKHDTHHLQIKSRMGHPNNRDGNNNRNFPINMCCVSQ